MIGLLVMKVGDKYVSNIKFVLAAHTAKTVGKTIATSVRLLDVSFRDSPPTLLAAVLFRRGKYHEHVDRLPSPL